MTVSFSGYDKLLSNVGMIGKLGGNPNMDKMLEMMLTMMTQGKGLAGLDKKQPWGAVLLPDEQQMVVVYGFLPVVDLKQLMELAKSNPKLGKIEEKDGVYEIPTGPISLYITQKGHWAVIARSADDWPTSPPTPPSCSAICRASTTGGAAVGQGHSRSDSCHCPGRVTGRRAGGLGATAQRRQ